MMLSERKRSANRIQARPESSGVDVDGEHLQALSREFLQSMQGSVRQVLLVKGIRGGLG
jgi:hypothetical protein